MWRPRALSSEETQKKTKPMVTVGGLPILCHIINIYKKNGFNDFILATGYKSNVIKNYFSPKVIKNWAVKLRLFYRSNTMTGGESGD